MITYSFSVLRYIHDVVSGEFVNVGVAVFSADASYLKARCTNQYGRINRIFDRIDGDKFKSLMRHIEDAVTFTGDHLRQRTLPFADLGATIDKLLERVLPPDDSGIRFAEAGYGVSADLEKTLESLYERYVDRYAGQQDAASRTDEDIWRIFRTALEKRHLLTQLAPKRIVAPDYEYEFKAAWKNDKWHVYEPVSFDLVDSGSIIDKANRWLGRMTNLSESNEPFQLHLLLGLPEDPRLSAAADRAKKILEKTTVPTELVSEPDAEAFAQDLEYEIGHHGLAPNQHLGILNY